jgi:demethylspheroidene O-methyltransferase
MEFLERSLPTWLDRCIAVRDRLLSNATFQRRAAGLPLARLVARRRARELFDLCAGFVYSQILLACVELDLFDILLDGPQTTPALADRLGLPLPAAERLLSGAVSLRLVDKRAGARYGLGVLGAAIAGNPGVAAMIRHHAHFYADLGDPVALLKGEHAPTELSGYWPYANAEQPASLQPEQVAPYSRLMALSQPLVADEVLDLYPLSGHRRLLDVGGGEGNFLMAAAARAPQLSFVLFDLPAVIERARARLAVEGMSHRIEVVGGDFFRDPLPRADVIALNRIILDHEDKKALVLLRAARRALEDGGTLLIAEPMRDAPGAGAMGAAYFNFYLLAMGHGRSRSRAELENLLQQAGFGDIQFRSGRRLMQTCVLVAKRRGIGT